MAWRRVLTAKTFGRTPTMCGHLSRVPFLPEDVQPVCVREDGPRHFRWRIRQLWYAADVFSVSIDHKEQCIVIRTSNHKSEITLSITPEPSTSVVRYYKRLTIPEMKINGLPLDEASLSWKHEMSTLLLSYKKPVPVLEEVGIEFVRQISYGSAGRT